VFRSRFFQNLEVVSPLAFPAWLFTYSHCSFPRSPPAYVYVLTDSATCGSFLPGRIVTCRPPPFLPRVQLFKQLLCRPRCLSATSLNLDPSGRLPLCSPNVSLLSLIQPGDEIFRAIGSTFIPLRGSVFRGLISTPPSRV